MNDEYDGKAKKSGIKMSTLKKYFEVRPLRHRCRYGKHYTLTCLDCGKSGSYCTGSLEPLQNVQKAIIIY